MKVSNNNSSLYTEFEKRQAQRLPYTSPLNVWMEKQIFCCSFPCRNLKTATTNDCAATPVGMVSLFSTWEATSTREPAGLPIPAYLWRAAQPRPDRLPAWKHRTGRAASSPRESPGLAAAARSTPLHWMPQTAGRVTAIHFSYDIQPPRRVKYTVKINMSFAWLLKKLSCMHLLHQLSRARYPSALKPALAKINGNIPILSEVTSYSVRVKTHILNYYICSH